MRIKLRDAEVGDRFVANTGVAWTVASNGFGVVVLVSEHQQPYVGTPPADMEVEVTNRDPSLTEASALANLSAGGIAGRVITVEGDDGGDPYG
jgi:hypothetical protein